MKKIIWVLTFIIFSSFVMGAYDAGGGGGATTCPCDCKEYEECDRNRRELPDGRVFCNPECYIDWSSIDLSSLSPATLAEIADELPVEDMDELSVEQMGYLITEIDDLTIVQGNSDAEDAVSNFFKESYGFEFNIGDVESDVSINEEDGEMIIDNNGAELVIEETEEYESIELCSEPGDGFTFISDGEEYTVTGAESISFVEEGIDIDGMEAVFLGEGGYLNIDDTEVSMSGMQVGVGNNELSGDVEFSIKKDTSRMGPDIQTVTILDKSQPITIKSQDSYACADDKSKCSKPSSDDGPVLLCLECSDISLDDLDQMIENGEIVGYTQWDRVYNAQGEVADSATVRGFIMTVIGTNGTIIEGNHKDIKYDFRDDGDRHDLGFTLLGSAGDEEIVGKIRVSGQDIILQNIHEAGKETLHFLEPRTVGFGVHSSFRDILEFFTNSDEPVPSYQEMESTFDSFQESFLPQCRMQDLSIDQCLERPDVADLYSEIQKELIKTLYNERQTDAENPDATPLFMHHDSFIVSPEGDAIDVENLYIAQSGNILMHQYETANFFKDYLSNDFMAEAYQEAHALGLSGQMADTYVIQTMEVRARSFEMQNKRQYFNGYIEYAEEANWDFLRGQVKDWMLDEESAYLHIEKLSRQTRGMERIDQMRTDPNNPMSLTEIYELADGNHRFREVQEAFEDPGLWGDLVQENINKGKGTIIIDGVTYDLSSEKAAATIANRISTARSYNEKGFYTLAQNEYLRALTTSHGDLYQGKSVSHMIIQNWDKIGLYCDYRGRGCSARYPRQIQELADHGLIQEELLIEMLKNRQESQARQNSENMKKFLAEMLPDSALDLTLNLAFEPGPISEGIVATRAAFKAWKAGYSALPLLKSALTLTGSVAGAGILGMGSPMGGLDDFTRLADEGIDFMKFTDDGFDVLIDGQMRHADIGDELWESIMRGDPGLRSYALQRIARQGADADAIKKYYQAMGGAKKIDDIVERMSRFGADQIRLIDGDEVIGDRLAYLLTEHQLTGSKNMILPEEVEMLRGFIKEMDNLGFQDDHIQYLTESVLYQTKESSANALANHGAGHIIDDYNKLKQVLGPEWDTLSVNQQKAALVGAIFHDVGYTSDIIALPPAVAGGTPTGVFFTGRHPELGASVLSRDEISSILREMFDEPDEAMDLVTSIASEHGNYPRDLAQAMATGDDKAKILSAFGFADDTSTMKATPLMNDRQAFEIMTNLAKDPENSDVYMNALRRNCEGNPICLDAVERVTPVTTSFNAPRNSVTDARYVYDNAGNLVGVEIDYSMEALQDLIDMGAVQQDFVDDIYSSGGLNPWARDFPEACPGGLENCLGANDDGLLLFAGNLNVPACDSPLGSVLCN